jgi:hypothetical protein
MVGEIVTLNEQVFVLSEPSVAVQVTVLVPMAKVEPDGGVQFVVTDEQLSVAVAA